VGSHPINLAVRFVLEVAGLCALAYWGWTQSDGMLRFVFALGIPAVAATLWGTFAVPNDPSRSGKSPVPVPGIVRLFLELAFFGIGVWALHDAGLESPSLIFAAVTVVHYVVSYDRIAWLVQQT
jgi:hypothetical protein